MAVQSSRELVQLVQEAEQSLSTRVIGKTETKRLLFVALVSQGHVLLEGPPGTAKTTLAKEFAQICGGSFSRIQFTPDMLPADVTGFYLYGLDGQSRHVAGPLFANFVLADELNRTTPRTQSALIEAMQERQVTLEGQRHLLPSPFMVIASQVPSGGAGTFSIIDVQMDRFMFRLESHYPSLTEERSVLRLIDEIEDRISPPSLQLEHVAAIQDEVKRVFVADVILDYITRITHRLRDHDDVAEGPSARGSIALLKGARSVAFLEGRDFVIPDDVLSVADAALCHRIWLKPEAEASGVTVDELMRRTFDEIPSPSAQLSEHG